MRLYTTSGLLYPITVTKILRQPGDDISQNAALFTYQYKSQVTEYDEDKREDVENTKSFYGTFESELEGNVTDLYVKVGQTINGRTSVADIEEPCKHEIQYGGICANCGKDMTIVQYTTTARDIDRATVNTIHGHTRLLVSREEAGKADEEAKRRLLESRKLSLVVDLDQTIIHATVDPTVAEWQRDTSNPNYEAVKDVRAFQLVDDGPGARGCWYYIKLRPGLQDFLQQVSRQYELHIYTMGTRAYAENIAKIIDPDRKFFGERILSRDESGSMTAKNLKRLFPVDTKMVVIIDDRGDVWHWSQNLVKVSPYDFFVGIGDINSSFLPKRPGVDIAPPAAEARSERPTNGEGAQAPDVSDGDGSSAVSNTGPATPVTNGNVTAVDQLLSMAGNQDEDSIKEKAEEQDEQIAAQLADRPLLQKQRILDAAEEEAKTSPAAEAAAALLSEDGERSGHESAEHSHPRYRHNLLQDDDTELQHLGQSLGNIHQAYFDEYDRDSAGTKGGRVAALRPGHSKKRPIDELDNIPDAALLMADMKAKVLDGVQIVFSGVVPLGVNIQSHDIAVWARSFGATVGEHITKRTTHVIASPERRTAKVRQAAKRGGRIAIVSQGWLFACFSQWKKVAEDHYRIHSDAPTNGTAITLPDSFETREDLMLSSSDEEAARTEDEGDTETAIDTPRGQHEGLAIDTDVEDLVKHKPSDDREDSSPTGDEQAEDWEGINDELAEFLGSEEENDSDSESVRSETPADRPSTPSGRSKRKRDAAQEALDDAEQPSDRGSKLQKRKKEAIERTSSLTNIVTLPSPSRPTGAEVADNPPAAAAASSGGGEDETNNDELDLDLEAALEAEFEKGDE